MKFILFLEVMLICENVISAEAYKGPVDFYLYSYCNLNKECFISLSMENKTPYKISLISSFPDERLSPKNLEIFNAERYRELELKGNNVYQSKMPIRSTSKESSSLVSVDIEPSQKVFKKLSGIQNMFEMRDGEVYFVKYYLPFVDVYVDGDFVGTKSFRSNFSELAFPKDIKREIRKE